MGQQVGLLLLSGFNVHFEGHNFVADLLFLLDQFEVVGLAALEIESPLAALFLQSLNVPEKIQNP